MTYSKSGGLRRPFAGFVHAALLVIMVAAGLVPSSTIGAVVPEQLVRVVAAKNPGTVPASVLAPAIDFTPKWGTGSCNSLLPGGFGGVPGDVANVWYSLQQQAIAQVEAFYGQNSSTDPSSTVALVQARGLTRALMFATLVKAINDVHSGTYTSDEHAWVVGFNGVVQYGREWMTIDAINRWNAYNGSSATQSSIANSIVSLFFGLSGLPWRNDIFVPSAEDLLNQAESALWGPPVATADGANGDIQNYPLASAESATAVHEMAEALAFLNAIGQTQIVTPGSGSDSTATTVMANIESALGAVSAGEMAEALIGLKELGSTLASGEGGVPHAAVFIAFIKSYFALSSAVSTVIQLNDAESKAFDSPDLYPALGDSAQFAELVNDFVAMTLHPLPSAIATGNDPDCRTVNKPGDASPPAADATLSVNHYWHGPAPDYSYSTQVLGGNAPGTIGPLPLPPWSVNDPSVLDWSYSRDVGPGAPRMGANWPISQITYGVPGFYDNQYDPKEGVWHAWGGYWYITFDGADGTPRVTAPLHVYTDSSVHPWDSDVAKAIVDADPDDFPCNPASGSSNDPALNPADKANYPCLDWNPGTHLGTMLIVRGDQPDNNGNTDHGAVPNYQVIFNILVKGDLGDWSPVFVGHGGKGPGQFSECFFNDYDFIASAGVCVGFNTSYFNGPSVGQLSGDVVESRVLWHEQKNDVCANDPRTCGTLPSYGWPTPYPIERECQSISPAAGMFVIEYTGQVNPNNPSGSCNNLPNGGSWKVTPSIHYRSLDDGLWVAWRVPPTIGTSNFLNIQAAQRLTGSATISASCGNKNGTCVSGSGTHWLSELQKGDGVMLVDPSTDGSEVLGGILSVIRKVDVVLDDTHVNLSSSVECLAGSDGNDCEIHDPVGYTSSMDPASGSDPGFSYVAPVHAIYKMTEQNPGTTCPVWDSTSVTHPPSSGCYYSNSIQFQAQTYVLQGQNDSWWNVSLPAPPVPPAARTGANAPTSGLEPWLDQPVITQQPESIVVNAGASPSFISAASGSPTPTVQWQRSIDSGSTWNNVSGATNTTYMLNAVTSGQSGWAFRAVFTNTNGSRTTRPATLGIYAAPQITLDPTSVPAAQLGDPITLTSAATGAPQPSANWQFSSDNGLTWNGLGGATSALSLSAGPSPAPSLLVRVAYTNDAGSATSQAAVVALDDIFRGGFEQQPGP